MRCTCFPPSKKQTKKTCYVVLSAQEVAEPLQDLKEGMEQLEKNKTLRYILSTLLAIGNFLNGSNVSHKQPVSLRTTKSKILLSLDPVLTGNLSLSNPLL